MWEKWEPKFLKQSVERMDLIHKCLIFDKEDWVFFYFVNFWPNHYIMCYSCRDQHIHRLVDQIENTASQSDNRMIILFIRSWTQSFYFTFFSTNYQDSWALTKHRYHMIPTPFRCWFTNLVWRLNRLSDSLHRHKQNNHCWPDKHFEIIESQS